MTNRFRLWTLEGKEQKSRDLSAFMIVNRTAGDSGGEGRGIRRSQRLCHDGDGGRWLWRSQRLHARNMTTGDLKVFIYRRQQGTKREGGGEISTHSCSEHDNWISQILHVKKTAGDEGGGGVGRSLHDSY